MRKVCVIINTKKPLAKENLNKTQELLTTMGFRIGKNPDFVVALGGDGTLLSAVDIYARKNIPILGINLGGLGFLTDVKFSQFSEIIEHIKKKKFRIEKRMLIRADIKAKKFYALNDIIICTKIPGRVVEFSATIDGEYICRFIADGIIIATPTGSTAYSLSTGGPILLPETEGIILTPICPHTLSVRPIVLPASSTIEIQVGKKGSAILVADGQRTKFLKPCDTIRLKKAEFYVRLIKPLGLTFFNTLREKLKWGGRENA